ncbi:MCE family protein [Mycolicibacterium sp. HS_4_1]
MKSFAERNPVAVGGIGVAVTAALTAAALSYSSLPFIHSTTHYSAYFSEIGGLATGAMVQVSGMKVGEVSDIELQHARVLVQFTVDESVALGDESEAAIKTKSLLGNRMLEITPRGKNPLRQPISVEHTHPPYNLPDALGDLATTVSDLNTDQLSQSLATLSQTFHDTPPDVQAAVHQLGRFSQTLNERDEQLRGLLTNANRATTVLAQRTDAIAKLIADTNALLAELSTQSQALNEIASNTSALARQLSALVADNRAQLRPALDKLNGVLTLIDDRKTSLQAALKMLHQYAMSFGEALASGPFFKAYLVNLLPGQFIQPFVEAAFSDLGLDPHVQLPSQLTDPPTGQPGTPALPVPYPRTGQGGQPRMTVPDAITGKPGDNPCGPPGLPLPGPGCYPSREPIAAPPPGGAPPGPPALAEGQTVPPAPSTTLPLFIPAPGEVPAPRQERP